MSNSPIQYPTPFSLKAMGEDQPGFPGLVFEIVARHVPNLVQATAVSVHPSRAGTYISVTVRFTAHSRAQLDAIYHDLSKEKRVKIAL